MKSDGLHAAPERAADERPRLTGGDQIEQSSIFLGRPIASAVLHSHQSDAHLFALSPALQSQAALFRCLSNLVFQVVCLVIAAELA